jgi:excisionase family DNA binding protein
MKIGDVEVLTLGQAAKRIGVDRTVLWRQVQRGSLKAINDGPPFLVSLEELDRYEREHKGRRGNYDHKTAVRKPKGGAS